MADEDLIDYNEEEEQTEIVAEKESKKWVWNRMGSHYGVILAGGSCQTLGPISINISEPEAN